MAAGPDTVDIAVGSEEVRAACVDTALAAVVRMVAVAQVAGVRRLGSRRRANSRLAAGTAACGEDWLMVEHLWDSRRRTWKALAGCCKLIGGGGCRDLKRGEARFRTVCGCEGRWVGIEVAIAGMGVLDRRRRRAGRCFGVDIEVLECGILLGVSIILCKKRDRKANYLAEHFQDQECSIDQGPAVVHRLLVLDMRLHTHTAADSDVHQMEAATLTSPVSTHSPAWL